MDFIVLGGILGALLMVVGTVLRDVLPRRLRIPGDDTPWVDVRDRRRTVRSALAAGRLLTIAGVIVLLGTVLMVFLDTGDTAAFAVVVGLTLLGLLGAAGWVLWYRYQESTGAIQRRQLQLIASRLGPARPAERSRERRPLAAEPNPQRPGRRPEAGPDPRPPRRDEGESVQRRLAQPDRPERESHRTPEAQVERAEAARQTERYPTRREPHLDHHPVAPNNDRPAPRPRGRDPLRQPAQHLTGPERDIRSDTPPPPRPRESEPRPSGTRPRPSQSRPRP